MGKLNVGRRIYQARNERGMTVAALAEMCGINDVYLRHIEGGIKTPSLPVFVDICNALKVSPDYLLREDLADNEISDIKELSKLWADTSLSRQKTAVLMLKALFTQNEE